MEIMNTDGVFIIFRVSVYRRTTSDANVTDHHLSLG